jgi:hypothetical protein
MLRIGERDPQTGLYWVLDSTGAVLGLGRKEFNQETQPGDRVVGQLRADGVWVLVGRDGSTATTTTANPTAETPLDKGRDKPIYRNLDLWNVDEEPDGDYTYMRLSLTNRNIAFGDYQLGGTPSIAGTIHCNLTIGGAGFSFDYPGLAEAPTPILSSGGGPWAWIFGEREPSILFPWRRVVLVVKLSGAKAAGFATAANPLIITMEHRLFANEQDQYPGPNPTTRRSAPFSIWRLGFARESDGSYLSLPPDRDPEWRTLGNLGNPIWHTGTPARLGYPPQAYAESSFSFQEGVQDIFHNSAGNTLAARVSQFTVTWPTYTIDTLAPSSTPSTRGFRLDYNARGYMLPENPLLYTQLGIPFPSTGLPEARTLRTVLLPRPRGKKKAPIDPAFASGWPYRQPIIHGFASP